MPKAGGKWNTFEITAKDRCMTVVLNGKSRPSNLQNGMFDEGHVTLQYGERRGEIPQGRGEAAVTPERCERHALQFD